ncbi:cytochrome P450 [Actinoplanes sp. OR16]|uniref:cytochrome P450 n=1 Tax=Actinoplanes sp. OR16 TaxID=946334 RepID=UPI000F6D4EAD|nr:cytochrome P450 [Actinoplanes sp. OR16]BBH67854.1 cytochrome P450 [Actinoplanes sp. OR16]
MTDIDTDIDFDTHAPEIAADPFPTYEKLRSGCPVKHTGAWGGYWVAAGHAEVASAARDTNFRTAQVLADGTVQGVSIPPLGHTGRLVPLEVASPQCLKYRKLLARFYSTSRVAAREAEFRSLAAACVDAVIADGSCDIVDALTLRLPAIITMRDIGVPEDRWRDVDDLVHEALLSAPHDLDGARDAAQMACLDIIEAMDTRGDAEHDDLIDHLRRSEIDGAPVGDDDIVSMLYLLLLGIDPTSTLTATALWHLARNPELRDRLIADPSLIPQAGEEFLRWVSPVQATNRSVGADTELGGRQLAEGDRVMLTWASANRDEGVFADAGTVDLDRDAGRHVAFGGGQHFCLGAGIVRSMFLVMMEEVLTRMPDYRIADPAGVEWFPDLSSVYGVSALPITFTPA